MAERKVDVNPKKYYPPGVDDVDDDAVTLVMPRPQIEGLLELTDGDILMAILNNPEDLTDTRVIAREQR